MSAAPRPVPVPASDARVLVLGYGNPSRGDDGAGPALAERLASLAVPGVTVETDYQLSIEHAALAAEHDVVVFADAATDLGLHEPLFYFRPVTPQPGETSLSHAISPAQVLFLAGSCFGAAPSGYVLGIRASVLEDFSDGLSDQTSLAVDAALAFLLEFVGRRAAPPESERRDA